MKILLIYTGGTIGMMKDYTSGSLYPFDFDHLYQHLPELNRLDCQLNTLSFENPIDSSNIQPSNWVYLGQLIQQEYDHYDSFVILHGTDTMSYTASMLSFMLNGLQKPVIFTGSQLPVGDLRTDAKENLITSIYIASLKHQERALVREVCIYFEYKLYRANRTTKFSSKQFDAFISPNEPHLIESGVNLQINHNLLLAPAPAPFSIATSICTDIAVLKLFPGIDQRVVNALIDLDNLKALIIQTYGSGNASTEVWFLEALRRAQEKGLVLINKTDCLAGGVEQGKYETSLALLDLGVLSSYDMTFEASLTKAMLGLGMMSDKSAFIHYFTTNQRNELTSFQS